MEQFIHGMPLRVQAIALMGRPRSFGPLDFFIAPLGYFGSIDFWGFQGYFFVYLFLFWVRIRTPKNEECINGVHTGAEGVLKELTPGSALWGLRRRRKRVSVLASNSLFPTQATDSRGA